MATTSNRWYKGSTTCLQLLEEAKADLNIQNSVSGSHLTTVNTYNFCQMYNHKSVHTILPQEGFTALMIAIQSGRTVKRDILLGGDIDLNVVDRVS